MSALRLMSQLLDELECGDWTAEEFACLMLLADGRQTSQALQAKFKLSENQLERILARAGGLGVQDSRARTRTRGSLGDPGPGGEKTCSSEQDSCDTLHVLNGSQDSNITTSLVDVQDHVRPPGGPKNLDQGLRDSKQDSRVPGETRARKYNQRKPRVKKAPDEAQLRAQELKNAIAQALFEPPLERKHWALVNKLYRRLQDECGAEFSLDNWREYVQDCQTRGIALNVPVALGAQSGYAAWLVRRQPAQSSRQMRVVYENGVRRITYA